MKKHMKIFRKITGMLALSGMIYFFMFLDPVLAFWITPNQPVHQGITFDALNNNPSKGPVFQATLSDGSTFTFSDQSIDEIVRANVDVDDNQTDAFLHFDNETIESGSARLKNIKDTIISKIQALPANQNGAESLESRSLLGAALHTLQDYYSHSTWVEINQATNIPTLYLTHF